MRDETIQNHIYNRLSISVRYIRDIRNRRYVNTALRMQRDATRRVHVCTACMRVQSENRDASNPNERALSQFAIPAW